MNPNQRFAELAGICLHEWVPCAFSYDEWQCRECKQIFSVPLPADPDFIDAREVGLRHGYRSYNPKDPDRESNCSLLSKEIGHVKFIIGEMIGRQDISAFIIQSSAEEKRRSIGKYLHHNAFIKEAHQ